MLRHTHKFQDFLSTDERGGGTVWGLTWFMLLVGICGMAVDTTDGFRNKTMLQATADTAALAGVVDLPSAAAATATAVSYSDENMAASQFGDVLNPADVAIGTWDHDARTFQNGGAEPDAVLVNLRQTAANANAVPVNFLRIVGLRGWDVNVQAVAQRFIPDCVRDGLNADGLVDISSNNGFVMDICIHGQEGVALSSNNFFESGVNVSVPNLDEQLTLPASGFDSNIGLRPALRERSMTSRLVPRVDQFMDDLLTMEAYVTPPYVDTSLDVEVRDERWDFADAAPGHIYHIQCMGNQNANMPNNLVLVNMVIIADCRISVGTGVTMVNVILGSRSSGNPGQGNGSNNGNSNSGAGGAGIENATVTFSSMANLGLPDNCAPGGGVQIFSNASVAFSSSMTLNGVQVIAAGDVDLGARDQGINGINVHAGLDITLSSNNMFGLCSGGSPDFFPIWHYRLVN